MRPSFVEALRSRAVLLVALLGTSAYAVLRYNVFKGVGWERLPLYVLNKALAWSSIVLFAVAALRGWRRASDWGREPVFAQGAALAAAHSLISLVVLGPAELPDLYAVSGRLEPVAGVALLAGVVAAVELGRAGRRSGLGVLVPAAVLVHAALLGYGSWLRPGQWPGFMVPVTLWSALVAAVTLVLVWAARRRSAGG